MVYPVSDHVQIAILNTLHKSRRFIPINGYPLYPFETCNHGLADRTGYSLAHIKHAINVMLESGLIIRGGFHQTKSKDGKTLDRKRLNYLISEKGERLLRENGRERG